MSKIKIIIVLTVALIGVISTSSVHAAGLTIPFGHTVNVNTNAVNINGDVNNEGILQSTTGAINLSGNWSNVGAGTFDSGAGTVTLNSTTNGQSVTTRGTLSTFNILTVQNTHSEGVTFSDALYCDTLNAESGVLKLSFYTLGTHTIATFNVNGSSGNLIVLASTISGTQWNLDTPSTTVNFLNVSDSHEIDLQTITACDSIGVNQNNTNWDFSCSGSVNTPPTADAGDNLDILTSEQSGTTLAGIANDIDVEDSLNYRWLEGSTVLLSSTLVSGGAAPLDLSTLSAFSIGEHTLTLEVEDGINTPVTDVMVLTIANSPPVVAPAGAGTFEVGGDIELSGSVADFDGETLNYKWFEVATIFESSSIATNVGGAPVNLIPHTIYGGLPVGIHIVTLEASDGVNLPESANIEVIVEDTTNPKIHATVIQGGILWPPNHQMVDVVIQATASDNSGLVTLSATVASSEPPDTDGDGNTIPDYTTPAIDQFTGEITLQLRSERKGQGIGRVYTITVTATDDIGNSSDTTVEIVAPHDKGKK
ncbi:uncharacterized protein SCALIN_C01_0241 [Candidatus Scalindua japonica]|uniref:Uncharacterized protein n=1 Tax=Candidatus Scalindua japonica TaxID=1284222 RepID=A0A286TTT4_9BACT|nr:hypothetical protein [Candidatus Scalindua japonica]GAX59310.1 uncharacterized protein SCALIN_C01_0241 [Candidatus Scalindua japonica]